MFCLLDKEHERKSNCQANEIELQWNWMEWNWDPEKWRSKNKTKSLSTKIVTKFNYRPLTTAGIFHVYDGITWFMTRHQINRSNQRFICEIELLRGATRGEIFCVRRTYFTSRAFVAHHHSNRFFPSLFIIDHYSVFVSLNEIQAEIFVIGSVRGTIKHTFVAEQLTKCKSIVIRRWRNRIFIC